MIKNDPGVHLTGTWATAGLTYAFSHLHMFHLYLNPQPAGKELGKMALWGPVSWSHAIFLAYGIHTSSTLSWNLAPGLWNHHRADCRGKKILNVKGLCSRVSLGWVCSV